MVAVAAGARAVAMMVHKSHIPLSSIGSLCYALAGFLHKILRTLARKSESFIKDLGHFIQSLKYVNFQSLDILVSFDVISLFSNVPVIEALQVISNKLHADDTLALEAKAIMEQLEVCLRTTHFQMDKFFEQREDMAMVSSLSPIVSNICMEH
jgi:hypothetical protein